jgi:transglutaminase-like putative cysteine protease
MRIDTGFRLALYLSLGLACLCLSNSEQEFVPGIFFLAGPVVVLLGIAWWTEGTWSLSPRGANILGGLIAVGVGVWLASRLLQTEDIARDPLVWLPSSLPYLGPLLMAVMVAKVFQPKQERDYWFLQGIGFLHIVLACVLATGMAMGPFFFGYLFTALWCLGLFSLRRHLARHDGHREICKIPWRLLGLSRAGRWGLLTLMVGVTFFLITPRATDGEWSPFSLVPGSRGKRGHGRTGHSDGIDLNSSGAIKVDDEPAFFVTVTEDRQGAKPKLDLGEDQRWRGIVLDQYVGGRWRGGNAFGGAGAQGPLFLKGPTNLVLLQNAVPDPFLQPRFELIDLGPDQFYVTFRYLPAKAGGLFVADPLVLPQGLKCMPMIPLEGPPLFSPASAQATFTPSVRGGDIRAEVAYRQVTVPAREGQRFPAIGVAPEYAEQLTIQPVPDIRDWTHELLRQLAQQRSAVVTNADVDRAAAGERLAPERQSPVAQALCDYLAHSSEFSYTLDRPRKDLTIDPTLDFLVNTKEGHCERFASALALMLRSIRLPARIVKGFRGANNLGDGQYQIKQSDAHSWVEALVAPAQPDGVGELGWLTLDPTPLGDATAAEAFSLSRWWSTQLLAIDIFWRDFIMNYSPEKQQTLTEAVSEWLGLNAAWRGLKKPGSLWRPVTVAGALSLLGVAGVWMTRRRRPRSQRPTASPPAAPLPCYARLLALLQRSYELSPLPAQTPQEFSDAARVLLLRGASAAPFAEVPAQVVALLYRIRYGGQRPDPEETEAIDRRLHHLDLALEDDRVRR